MSPSEAISRILRALRPTRIRHQLIVGVALIHLLLMSAFVFDLVRRQRAFLSQHSFEETQELAQTLALNSSSWILANDVVGLGEIVGSVARFPDLRYAMVTDRDGKVLAHTDPSQLGLYASDERSRSLLSGEPVFRVLHAGRDSVDVAAPVMSATGECVGWARLSQSQRLIAANLSAAQRSGVLYTVLAVLIGSAFAMLIASRLAAGLDRLLSFSGEIRDGRRDLRMRIDGDDEVSRLGAGINEMLDALLRAERELQESKALIEAVVENVPLMIFLKEATDLRFILFNRAGEELLGHDRKSLLGKSDRDFFPAEQAEFFMAKDRRVLDGDAGVLDIPEEPIMTAKKGRRLLHTRKVCIRGADGVTKYLLGISEDITERRRAEDVNMARLRLIQFGATHAMDELLQATLDEAEALSGSLVGFYHFLEADQKTLSLQNWSTRTKAEFCKAEGKGSHYDAASAGVWVDCLRERKAIIHNDYASLPHRKGLPPGHAAIIRELVVPVFRGDKIVAILGVGNKPQDYTPQDIDAISLLADLAWEIVVRNRAEEAVRRSGAYNRSLIEASLDPLVTIGPDGKITDVNSATELATGRTREELIGSDFSNYFTEPERARAGYRKVFEEGRVRDYDLEIRRRDGSVTPVLYNAAVYNDEKGRAAGVFAAARDVTARKRAEDEIRRLNADLEERVRRRTAQVEAANKELEAFTYSVSHDLRAPLRSIDGFSQILLEDYAPKLEPECRRYLGLVRHGAQVMGQLIDDLLAFSRLGRQAMAKAPVAMEEVVRAAVESLEPQSRGRKASFKIGALAPCEGDFALLKQVWINLLSNALKFTRKREDALIEIDSHDEAGETVYRVKDNGVGFDMRYVDKLFKVFQRLHPMEEYEGTGVGLAIVARIVERHGGRAWARGEPGRGAEFMFTVGGRKS